MKKLGLYIHIPFCMKKCAYCDFYSIPAASEMLKTEYLTALSQQIDEYKPQAANHSVDSVFIGGGTPSLLDEKQTAALMKKIYSCFNVERNAEVTIEANPGTVDEKKLKLYKKLGINRLSLGVQSFLNEDLAVCGRIHKAQDSVRAFTMARNAGFDNINVDIMFGLPGQTMASLVQTLNYTFKLGADHISFYGLKIEEGTPFYEMRQTLALPDEDSESDMYFASRQIMLSNGYQHYEISNFAKRGKRCKHNMKYWNSDEYLGIGPAAHSYFAGKRFSFKKDIKLYIDSFKGLTDRSIVEEIIDIPHSARIAEYVMLRFRLSDGINCETFYKKFGRDFDSVYYQKLRPYINSGHIVRTKDGYAFSPEGMYVSNFILSRIIDFDMNIPGV